MITHFFSAHRHRWLAWACKLFAIALPLTVLGYQAVTPLSQTLLAAGMGHMQIALQGPAGAWLPWVLGALSVLPAICMSYALWHAARCFERFGLAEYFSLAVVRNLRGIAQGLLAAGMASVVMRPLASLLLSIGMPVGQRSLVLGLGSQEIGLLLISALLWQITSVMERAVALSEENKQFI